MSSVRRPNPTCDWVQVVPEVNEKNSQKGLFIEHRIACHIIEMRKSFQFGWYDLNRMLLFQSHATQFYPFFEFEPYSDGRNTSKGKWYKIRLALSLEHPNRVFNSNGQHPRSPYSLHSWTKEAKTDSQNFWEILVYQVVSQVLNNSLTWSTCDSWKNVKGWSSFISKYKTKNIHSSTGPYFGTSVYMLLCDDENVWYTKKNRNQTAQFIAEVD